MDRNNECLMTDYVGLRKFCGGSGDVRMKKNLGHAFLWVPPKFLCPHDRRMGQEAGPTIEKNFLSCPLRSKTKRFWVNAT